MLAVQSAQEMATCLESEVSLYYAPTLPDAARKKLTDQRKHFQHQNTTTARLSHFMDVEREKSVTFWGQRSFVGSGPHENLVQHRSTRSPGVWRTDSSLSKTRKKGHVTSANHFPLSDSPQTTRQRASPGTEKPSKAVLASSSSPTKLSTSMPDLLCATTSRKRFKTLCSASSSEEILSSFSSEDITSTMLCRHMNTPHPRLQQLPSDQTRTIHLPDALPFFSTVSQRIDRSRRAAAATSTKTRGKTASATNGPPGMVGG